MLISYAVIFILATQWTTKGLNEMFDHSELFGGTWPWAYRALCFSCGYFAYDQWDMLRYGLYSGWIPSILVHHLILLICFTLALYRNVTVNYLILTLICEVYPIILHGKSKKFISYSVQTDSKLAQNPQAFGIK